MRILNRPTISIILCLLLLSPSLSLADNGKADEILPYAGQSSSGLSSRYLYEARKYRAQGRYELARQSYVLALSICGSPRRLQTIRQELDGLELMLRTLR
ncbi:MAG: hypothetical protein IJU76_03455 [Desulfovibrionaceae bacterium]|nr:hypothetical protein [Desulfovibrionaceae bacterium]